MTNVSSSAPISFTGIESGLDTSAIINALLQVDEAPLDQLKTQQSNVDSQTADYQTIEQELQSLQSAADQLSAPNAFAAAVSASSSSTAVATATTGAGAQVGSTTFSVEQLATASTLVSSGTVASANDVVASGPLLVASGGSGIGIASVAGAGLALGAHTIAVTQASAGATVVGGAAVAGTTAITSANDQLTVTIDGTLSTFTIADGSYTASDLAGALNSASGGALAATIGSSGQLDLATAEQGSQATLQVGSGSANAALGLSASGPVVGTDGVITVDGYANTVSDVAASGTTPVTLTSGSGGTIEAQLSPGGLSVGSVTAQNIAVGNGSLSSVVAAINRANVGVTAEALHVGANQVALSVTSDATGAANAVSLDPSAFLSSGLGTMETTTAGQDAKISLGGAGGFVVSSTSNTVTGLLPGVSVSLQQVSASPVTISVAADGASAATTVQTFVNAANSVLQTISEATAFNSATDTAGPLNGDYQLQGLAQSLLGVVVQAVGNSSVIDTGTTGSAAGLSIDAATDQINFDPTTFAADYESDPSAVAQMFTQGGSFAPGSGSPAGAGDVSLVYASDSTQPGSYAIAVSQSASQAADTGSASFASGTSPVALAESYTVTSGGSSASYGITSGESLEQVASGLDGAFAQAGMNLSAQVVNNGPNSSLQITSADYGSQNSFSVTSTGADQLGLVGASFVGTDVAGTINGIAATGDGQVLAAPTNDPTLAGLSVLVTTAGLSSTTPLGTFSYNSGLAGGIAYLSAQAVGTGGELPSKITSLQASSTQLGGQITLAQQLVTEEQQQLDNEFDNLETTLSNLKSESSFLTSMFGASSDSLGSLTGSSSASTTSGSTTSGSSSSTTTGGT
jgi:flagellar hook-associated protein 2